MNDQPVEIHLRWMPHPHNAWEAYMRVDDERWGGNAMTYGGPMEAMTQLAQNLAEALKRAVS